MKKTILLTSVMTIVLCVCLIAGSTFALFTDTKEMNIAITSGQVDIDAKINTSSLELYSIKGVTPGQHTGYVDDPVLNERFYFVEEQQPGLTFANGGEATVTGDELKLARLTPGDKVSLSIDTANNSDVKIKTRVALTLVSGNTELVEALNVKVLYNGVEVDVDLANGGYVSGWTAADAGVALDTIEIVVELPAEAGNECQGMAANFAIALEAVQDNAVAGN